MPPSEPTRAVYVRMPDKIAQKLDRAAERFGVSKRDLLATLVSDHLDIEGDEIVFRPHGRGPGAPGSRPASGDASPAGGSAEGAGTAGAADAAAAGGGPSFHKQADGQRPPWPADTLWRKLAGTDPFTKAGPGRAEPPPAPPAEVIDLAEAAELLRVPEDDVRQLVESGELPGRRIGDHWRLTRTAVLAWLGGEGATPTS